LKHSYSYLMLVGMLLFGASAHAQEIQYFNVQSGTGFFVNRDYLVTNAHVVKGCSKVSINGAVPPQEADVIVTNEEHDLALIKSETQPADFAPLRMDIDTLKVNDNVLLIGYPGEQGFKGHYTVSTAQVKKLKLDKIGKPWQFYISDVIAHGNSGGPALDASGNVIGVVVGMMELTTMNSVTLEPISEERLGVVIALRALQGFLEDNGVYVQWVGSGLLTFGEGVLEENAKRYIVNVQCRMKTDKKPTAPVEELR
jgi:serine protease Do